MCACRTFVIVSVAYTFKLCNSFCYSAHYFFCPELVLLRVCRYLSVSTMYTHCASCSTKTSPHFSCCSPLMGLDMVHIMLQFHKCAAPNRLLQVLPVRLCLGSIPMGRIAGHKDVYSYSRTDHQMTFLGPSIHPTCSRADMTPTHTSLPLLCIILQLSKRCKMTSHYLSLCFSFLFFSF